MADRVLPQPWSNTQKQLQAIYSRRKYMPDRGLETPKKPPTKQLDLSPEEVSQLAYRLWEQRGRPAGSDQEDWFRAEKQLKTKAASSSSN
jgi:hypothetical protein